MTLIEDRPRPVKTKPTTGQHRDDTAHVRLAALETLWFNTGTLCNLACSGCYIDSSPHNDRLVYLQPDDMANYLAQIRSGWAVREIGLTGGEPFMNPHVAGLLSMALDTGLQVLVLSNAMRPLQRHIGLIEALANGARGRLTLRISLDHFDPAGHDAVRGAGAFRSALEGLAMLKDLPLRLALAARLPTGFSDADMRAGFAGLIADHGWPINADEPRQLVLFPDMDAGRPAPHLTQACLTQFGRQESDLMCARSRMVVREKGSTAPHVVSCTLLPHDPRFAMGQSLADAARPIALRHPFCAQFCVTGGARCS